MIASDIHGSAKFCGMMATCFENEGAARLLLLGDLLYHGPRNDLPDLYAPKEVASILNGLKDSVLCVRGNCEAEVDQMMLDFPVLADYIALDVGNPHLIYATHGHKFNENTPLPMKKGDILLCGHTHIPACSVHEDFVYLNPGSVSIPKEGSCHSYMTYEDGIFLWKNIEDGSVYREYSLV